MHLHLLRHPPVQLGEGICYGSSDVPAQSWSAAQVRILRDSLGAQLRVHSSPLSRCRVLAERLRRAGDALRIDARLREMDFGEWELQRYADIDRARIDAWAADPWHFLPPDGESADAMSRRVLGALDELLAEARAERAEAVLIVAHSGPLRVIQGHLRGLPREQWLDLACAPGSLCTVADLS